MSDSCWALAHFTAAILAGGAAIMAVAGILFFREAPSWQRIVGIAFAIIGLFLLFLADLAATLRHNGISLVLDFVFNHTANEHDWAKRAVAGELEFQDRGIARLEQNGHLLIRQRASVEP